MLNLFITWIIIFVIIVVSVRAFKSKPTWKITCLIIDSYIFMAYMHIKCIKLQKKCLKFKLFYNFFLGSIKSLYCDHLQKEII